MKQGARRDALDSARSEFSSLILFAALMSDGFYYRPRESLCERLWADGFAIVSVSPHLFKGFASASTRA